MTTPPSGTGEPCALCGEACDGFAGNPALWPVAICRKGSQGIPSWYHSGCIGKQLDEIAAVREALKPFAAETLTTEPGHNRTRLFSFEDYDAKIRAARAALGQTKET